jgi:hypothetical protein
MCFSAKASFITAAALFVTGSYTVKKTYETKDLSFLLIALMPLLFGIQQISEGFIWLFLGKSTNFDHLLSVIFLFFAFFLWPVWVPLSIGVFDHKRNKMFYVIAFIGLIYGLFLYLSTIFYNTSFHLHLCDKSVCYQLYHPMFNRTGVAIYLFCTIVPFLIAKSNIMKIFGLLLAISAMASGYFYIHAFTSVWCFFSAALSLYIGYMAYHLKKITKETN